MNCDFCKTEQSFCIRVYLDTPPTMATSSFQTDGEKLICINCLRGFLK